MRGERKKYALRATPKPARNTLVSSVFTVRNEAGEAGYCYVNFNSSFVEAVGKALPRGVSAEDRACITVKFYAPTKVWLVTASYVGTGEEVLLWRAENKPTWVNFYKARG